MSRHTRLLAPLSIAALFSLGLAAGQPAAQQADTPQTATPKSIAPSKKAARSESAAFLEVRGEVGTPQLYSKEEFARLRADGQGQGARRRRIAVRRGAADRPLSTGRAPPGGPVEGSNGD